MNNAALLLALGVLYDLFPYRPKSNTRLMQLLSGVSLGIIGIAVMVSPWQFAPGVIFDTRSILLSTIGLFFGLIPTVVATAITALFRIYQGGIGAWTGVAVIVTSAGSGLAWTYFRSRWKTTFGWLELYLFGIVVQIAMLLWMLSLPWSIAIEVLSRISLPVMVIYPLATVLLGKLLARQLARREAEQALQESEERLRQIVQNMPVMLDAFDEERKIIVWNHECERVTGYASEEIVGNPGAIELLYPDQEQREQMIADFAKYPSQLRNLEWSLTCKDSSLKTISWSNISDQVQIPGWFTWAVGVDVTDRVQALAALKETEERMRLAVSAANVGLWDWDLRTNQVYYSPEWKRQLGYEADEISNDFNEWQDRLHPDDLDRALNTVQSYLQDHRSIFELEFRLRHKNGAYRWILAQASLQLNEQGEPTRMLGSHVDITERKQAEEALQRYNQRLSILRKIDRDIILTRSSEAISNIILKRIRQLIPCQRASISLFDEDIKEAIIFALDLEHDSALPVNTGITLPSSPLLEQLRSGQLLVIPDLPKLEEPQSLHAKRLIEEGLRSLLIAPMIIRDQLIGTLNLSAITPDFFTAEHQEIIEEVANQVAIAIEQTRLIEQIQKHTVELEERVRQRTVQLEVSNRELEAFAYSVSHDLRAPLRGIDGFSKILLEDYAGNLDETGQHYLGRVRTATQRMAQLIDDLLRLSRISRVELTAAEVDLSAMAAAIAADIHQSQPDRQVTFDIAPELTVQADYNLIRIVLENLLRNAWKFTGKHSTARIELGSKQEEGETIYFVRDDGAGFDAAYADKLFGPFQRLHGLAEFEGTGIGLAIVQRIIRRHGGRVWAEGAVEQGATFYFTL